MIERRRFLIGFGSLLTAAFVGEAKAFARKARAPLILEPRKAEERLHIYDQSKWGERFKWRVSLGPDEYEPPPAPTWRENLIQDGYRLDTPADVERALNERDLYLDNLDEYVDDIGWESEWEASRSPQAKAHKLLSELDLGCEPNAELNQAGHMHFVDGYSNPMSVANWVELRDNLTVSLLQARLIELELPIKIVVGEMD